MCQYIITKIKPGIVKLISKANLADKNPGYELIYAVSDTRNISNLFLGNPSFTSYIYQWSFDPATSTITVTNTNTGHVNQKVTIKDLQGLVDAMFDYSAKPKPKDIVIYGQ